MGRCFWKRDPPPTEEETFHAGPENVITVRSGDDPFLQKKASKHRVPPSLGNKTWNVAHWTNSIKTSQYEWWNFIILNLWQQALVPANLYFLVMSILQLIPDISDSGGVPTYLFPLGFVFVVTMIKDGWEDIKRHQSDRNDNNRATEILCPDGKFVQTTWSTLRPGDIVKVKANEFFPADLLMLCCSDELECCYVETVQLDGETNMKTKTGLPAIHGRFAHDTSLLASCVLELSMGPPSAKLYNFNGALKLYDVDHDFSRQDSILKLTLSRNRSLFGNPDVKVLGENSFLDVSSPSKVPSVSVVPESFALSTHQFLWRGAQLVNTAWTIGIVAYTGHQSRIMKNTRSRTAKYSSLMRSYNYCALNLLLLQLLGCVVAATLYTVDVSKNQQYAWYLMPSDSRELSGSRSGLIIAFFISFGRYMLLMSYFIPITLLVQIEICRWFHGYFINCDEMAYSKETDSYPNISTLSIIEDLGCVTHVFSDKTGTLTQNVMQLKSFGIGSSVFGWDGREDENVEGEEEEEYSECKERDGSESSGGSTEAEVVERKWLKKQFKVSQDGGDGDVPVSFRKSPNSFVDFDACSIRTKLLSFPESSELRHCARDFLMVLALCHSVLPKASNTVERILDPIRMSKSAMSFSSSQGPNIETLERRRDGSRLEEVKTPTFCQPEPEASKFFKAAGEEDPQQYNSGFIGPLTTTTATEYQRSSPRRIVESSGATSPQFSPCYTSPRIGSLQAASRLESQQSSRQNSPRRKSLRMEDPVAQRRISLEISQPPPYSLAVSRIDNDNGVTQPLSSRSSRPAEDSGHSSFSASGPVGTDWQRSSAPAEVAEALSNSRLISGQTLSQAGSLSTKHFLKESLPPVIAHPSVVQAEEPTCVVRRPPSVKLSSPFYGSDHNSDNCDDNSPPAHHELLRLPPPSPIRNSNRPPSVLRVRNLRRHRDTLSNNVNTSPTFHNETRHAATPPQPPPPHAQNGVKVGVVRWNENLEASFDASSPDELALVAGAKHMGIEFLRRPDLNSVELAILNPNAEALFLTKSERAWMAKKRQELKDQSFVPALTFEVMEVLDFDNFRKRMSVIIRERDGSYKLLCKGADSSMLSALAGTEDKKRKHTEDFLADFAREGLRTLVLGVRNLTPEAYNDFKRDLEALRAAGTDDVELLANCYSTIEKDLILVGCTAIDDKLQEQVPQTIEGLKDAGIRVWVLTGDKVETAISIGFSCNLLTDTTYNAIIDGSTAEEVQSQMYQYMAFVVGAQLAKEAFDQILLQLTSTFEQDGNDERSPSSPSGAAESEKSVGCRQRCARPFKLGVCCKTSDSSTERRRRRLGNVRHTATMNLDDFVSVLSFNAKHRKIVAPVDGRVAPKQLSPEEVEQLISVYVSNFGQQNERKSSARIKLGELVGASTNRTKRDPPSLRETKTVLLTTEDTSPRYSERVEHFTSVAITITGDALQHALATDQARKYFFGLAHLCSTVIACRVTPKQKAEVVRQCGRCTPCPSFVSLGVGDGANDVGMILTANIGVGIYGKEGSQAARSADISIGEFRFLRNLLFAQGHPIVKGHAIMMYQTIYKNILFAMTSYFCGFFSGFSAADAFDSYLKQFYNLMLTPWPICSIATFDRFLPYDVLFRCASLYPTAMRADGTQYFGPRWFAAWLFYGITASAIIVVIMWTTIAYGATDEPKGRQAFDWDGFGQSIFYMTVLTAIIPSVPFTHTIFWFTPIAFIIGIGGTLTLWAILSSLSSSNLQGSFRILMINTRFHLGLLLAGVASMSLIFIWWRYRVSFRPTPPVVIRERIKKGVFDVVVAPRRRGELAVVVPRTHQRDVWKGFAYASSETRYSILRKSLSMRPDISPG